MGAQQSIPPPLPLPSPPKLYRPQVLQVPEIFTQEDVNSCETELGEAIDTIKIYEQLLTSRSVKIRDGGPGMIRIARTRLKKEYQDTVNDMKVLIRHLLRVNMKNYIGHPTTVPRWKVSDSLFDKTFEFSTDKIKHMCAILNDYQRDLMWGLEKTRLTL